MAELLLGIDVGTSSTKVVLLAPDGSVRGEAEASHPISQPHPGWSEQQPDDWWDSTCRAIRDVLAQSGVDPEAVAAIGMSGQMHGSVFLPRSADPNDPKPIRPALLWNDQRTVEQCTQIEAAAGGRAALVRLTGNPALTGMTLPKILWLRDHEPPHFASTAHVILPKDYIRFRLTGELATDFGDGSGIGAMNLRTRTWDAGLLGALGLEADLLPPLVDSQQVCGTITARAAEATGLCAGTPVVAGSGDQMTGAIGMGVVAPGIFHATLGTSGVVYAHVGSELPVEESGSLQMMCSAVPNEYAVYGCMLSAAGALHWCRETIAPGTSFAELDDAAALVKPGAEGLLFLPQLTGERCPFFDPAARGAWIGLTSRHKRGHLVRAVMEGVALTMAQMLERFRAAGTEVREVRLGGGGARSPLWRSMMTDCLDAPTTTLRTAAGSAYGAAMLAGVGVGTFKDVRDASQQCVAVSERCAPTTGVARYAALRTLLDDARKAIEPIHHQLGTSQTPA